MNNSLFYNLPRSDIHLNAFDVRNNLHSIDEAFGYYN